VKRSIPFALAVTLLLLAIIILLILDIHQASEKEVVSRFRAHQMMVVNQLSQSIQQYLRDRARGSEVISSFTSIQRHDIKKMKSEVQDYFQFLKKIYVREVTVYNEKGLAIYSTEPELIGSNALHSNFFQFVNSEQNKSNQFIGITHLDGEDQTKPFAIIATPVYREGYTPANKSQRRFAGALTITIDLGRLIADSLSTNIADASKEQIWILDTAGTILFQPARHPETVHGSISRPDKKCFQCHLSFNYADRVLLGKRGTIEDATREGSKKLAAFSLLSLENLACIVVVDAPLGEVSGFLRRQLIETLLLIGVIGVVFAGAFLYTYRNILNIIRAEEEAKQWRTKRELEAKILASEERYRQLVEISPDAIAVHCQGKITFVNQSAVRLMGAETPADILGKSVLEFVHPRHREMVKQRIMEILEAGKSVPAIEEQFLRLDGSTIDVEVAATPTTFDGMKAVQLIARDITERKKTEEAKKQLEEIRRRQEERHKEVVENIFRFVPEGVLVLTDKLQHFKHNRMFDEIVKRYSAQLGYTKSELAEMIIETVKKHLTAWTWSQPPKTGITLKIPEKKNEQQKNSSNNPITST